MHVYSLVGANYLGAARERSLGGTLHVEHVLSYAG